MVISVPDYLGLGLRDVRQSNFEGNFLCPAVFVLGLIQLSLILRKAKVAYDFRENTEKWSLE